MHGTFMSFDEVSYVNVLKGVGLEAVEGVNESEYAARITKAGGCLWIDVLDGWVWWGVGVGGG